MKMKRTLTVLVLSILISPFIYAQVSKTMNNVPGGLYKALPYAERSTITHLKLTGSMDARDFRTMRDAMKALEEIDLENIRIVAYSGSGGTVGTKKSKGKYEKNTIPAYAFYDEQDFNGENIVNIIFPKKLEGIGEYAFYSCKELLSVDLPATVVEIGKNAFYKCVGITSINVNTPDPIKDMGKGVFYAVDPSTCTLHVPKGAKDAYSNAKQWEDFLNIEEDIEMEQPEKE